MARIPLASSGASELFVDRGQEGCAHGLETPRAPLERAESARDRLDGGEAPWSRLPPQVSVAAGLLGRDADARQRGQEWVREQHLLGLRPRPVDDDEDVGRASCQRGCRRGSLARGEQGGTRHRRQLLPPRLLREAEAAMQLRVGQRETRQPGAAYGEPPLPRVLQEEHSGARRDRPQRGAYAEGLGPQAALAGHSHGGGRKPRAARGVERRGPGASRASRRLIGLLPPPRHRTLHLAFRLSLRDRVPSIGVLAAAGEPERHLGPALIEVDLERNERVAALLDLAPDLVDLLAAEQELAVPERRVAEVRGCGVLADAAVHQEQLLPPRLSVGVGERDIPIPERLHFAAGQRQPSLVALLDVVVEPGTPVRG